MKKKKRNKHKRTSYFVWLIAVLLIVAGGYLAYTCYMDPTGPSEHLPLFNRQSATGPLVHTDDVPPAAGFIHDGEPVIQTITRWHRDEQRSLADINRRLSDSFEVIVLDEDINANDHPNYLILHHDENLPALSTSLSDVGYTHVFRDLAVYEVRNSKLHPLLTIDHQSIRDGRGEQLIDQVAALNGYALLLETYEHARLYDKPVRLIEIVMIDGDGLEASDEITIYWDPSEASFKATNTFGAP